MSDAYEMSAVISIQVRMGSSRLPGKALLPIGGHRVIGLVVDQCETAQRPHEIVLAIGDRPENDAIIEWCDRTNNKYVIGDEDDLLTRHLCVAEQTDCDTLIRITGDCPFVPPTEISRVAAAHRTNQSRYTTNATESMPIGTAVDVIDIELLRELQDGGYTHPVKPLRKETDKWVTTVTSNETWTEFSDTHTAVDTPRDYWSLVDAVEQVGTDPYNVTEWLSTSKTPDER